MDSWTTMHRLACVGYIVPEYFRWPGYLSPEKGIKWLGWRPVVLFLVG